MPKENIHYYCIACITIDSVINFNKKNHNVLEPGYDSE